MEIFKYRKTKPNVMERPVSFFAMLFILLFAGISFIFVVFDLHGFSFIFELGLLLAFMLVLAFAMFLIFHSKDKSWGIIAAVMILLLFDEFIIYLLSRNFGIAYVATMLFALAGLIVAMINVAMIKRERKEPYARESYWKSKYYYPFIGKTEPKEETKAAKTETKNILKNVETTFTPGKFVASAKAKKFHTAKCDWALRISKSNQIWFNSKEEAQSKGFEADKCVV